MTDPPSHLVVVRGGGDLGSGVVWRLRRVGFPVVVLELERPLTVRRTVAFSSAITEGTVTYTRDDGGSTTLPFCNVFHLADDGRIREYRIYIDPTPLGATAA